MSIRQLSFKAAYYGLLATLSLLTIYTFYTQVFRFLEIRDGRLRMWPRCYSDNSVSEAAYFFCFSCSLLVSLGGLWLKKRWAYFLVHPMAVPAVLVFAVYVIQDLRYSVMPDWAVMASALAGLSFLVLLNANRRILFGAFRNRWKIVLIGLAGVVGNLAAFLLISICGA